MTADQGPQTRKPENLHDMAFLAKSLAKGGVPGYPWSVYFGTFTKGDDLTRFGIGHTEQERGEGILIADNSTGVLLRYVVTSNRDYYIRDMPPTLGIEGVKAYLTEALPSLQRDEDAMNTWRRLMGGIIPPVNSPIEIEAVGLGASFVDFLREN